MFEADQLTAAGSAPSVFAFSFTDSKSSIVMVSPFVISSFVAGLIAVHEARSVATRHRIRMNDIILFVVIIFPYSLILGTR